MPMDQDHFLRMLPLHDFMERCAVEEQRDPALGAAWLPPVRVFQSCGVMGLRTSLRRERRL